MNKGLVLTAASVGVAVVTLVGLNLVAPITLANEGHPAGTTPDQVFAGSIAEPGNTATEEAAPAPVEVAAADLSEPTMEVAAAEPASAPPPTDAGVAQGGACEIPAAGPAKGKVVAMVNGEPFSKIPVGSTAAAAAPAAQEVALAETAPSPVEEPAAMEPAIEEPAPAPEPEPVAEAAPPASEPEPVAQAATQPVSAGGSCSIGPADPSAKPVTVKSATRTSPTETASAPEPAYAAEATTETETQPAPKPRPSKPKISPAEFKKVWWPPKADGKLNLTYAGEASFTKAIVLLFDGEFDNADSANKHVKVTARDGAPVKGQWLVATNKKMLLFNAPPGVYKLKVGEKVTDKSGRTLPTSSSGLVLVP
ncbi:MAG: hypothetical protein ACT4PZ_24375 [Panacagrimonas sp.]